MANITPFSGPSKALRLTLRRDYQDGKPLPLRRTAFIIEIDITPALDGSFVVEVGGAPSFAVTKFEMRRWPAFRRRLENAIGCRVAAMTQAEWEWTVANRGLAPMTRAAEAWREADLEQFDRDFEGWCEYQQAVGADIARRRRVAREGDVM